MSKDQFEYHCLGPGALVKMRSSFRCLEDLSAPSEINSFCQFTKASKQRRQGSTSLEKASYVAETLYQGSMSFHDFITLFEDSKANTT